MSNTKDLREDGSRWAMLRGAPNKVMFQQWGASEIYEVPPEDRGGRPPCFMIRLKDGWHYAHVSDASAYADNDAYQATHGEAAWWLFVLDCATYSERSAEKSLAAAIEWTKEVRGLLAKAQVAS